MEIKSQGWDGAYMLYVNVPPREGDPGGFRPATAGITVQNFRGEFFKLLGGQAPMKSNSSGHVDLQREGASLTHNVYAGVINAKWVKQ